MNGCGAWSELFLLILSHKMRNCWEYCIIHVKLKYLKGLRPSCSVDEGFGVDTKTSNEINACKNRLFCLNLALFLFISDKFFFICIFFSVSAMLS